MAGGALQAYLRQAVRNRIRDEIRRNDRRPAQLEIDDGAPDPARSSLEEAIALEDVGLYESALERLRPEEREVIILRLEMEYSYEEVAKVLRKPPASAAGKAPSRVLVRLVEEMSRGR